MLRQCTTLWLLATLPMTAAGRVSAGAGASSEQRPGTGIEYRVESVAGTALDLRAIFTTTRLAVLEKLNRTDVAHLVRLDQLVLPTQWLDEMQYSPFPLSYPAAVQDPKLLVVDLASQAFAAYEGGHLARWGPVSSGRQASPTPSGLFHLNWRSRGRHSTVNPAWYMEWYFNFENTRGLSLHSYALPGYPASHACIRLLERDAIWIYEWGEGWTSGTRAGTVTRGTPLLVVGRYAFGAPPPWRSLAHLARGIDLPETPLLDESARFLDDQ